MNFKGSELIKDNAKTMWCGGGGGGGGGGVNPLSLICVGQIFLCLTLSSGGD